MDCEYKTEEESHYILVIDYRLSGFHFSEIFKLTKGKYTVKCEIIY